MNKFQKLKKDAVIFYKNVESIKCPYFGENIYFNAKGLEHLFFKCRQKVRSQKDQKTRLQLLSCAPEILKMSRTLQGVWDTKCFERIRII